uniref:G6F-LY6G6D fusion protein n=1 Tax=Mus musculus TaxID=10090 RepID=A0A1L6ZA42_MOUSE|nr:G6F-LY6G6D fusion protein [Mus musculus]
MAVVVFLLFLCGHSQAVAGLLQGPDPVPLLSCQDTARGAMTAVEAPATPASRQ